jgi:hypothetical protein
MRRRRRQAGWQGEIMRRVSLYLALMTCCVTATALAQNKDGPGVADSQRAQNFMSMWNPQVMIENSVKQATARYGLTPEQEQLARRMTTDGVNAFLDKHETEIRSLVRDAIQARISGTPPTAAQVQEWAMRASPLFDEAKQEILKGNQQFRESLNDEQKKTFDTDQKVLQQQITSSKEKLDSWTKGKFNPETDWNTPPRPRPTATGPVRPALDRWDLYVRGFISRFKLDPAQTSQAEAILMDSKNRATEYYFSRKPEIEAASQHVKDVLADSNRREQIVEARKRVEDLNKPIDTLYAEMQQRLNRIPTEAQRKANEAEVQARRDRWRNRTSRPAGDTAMSATSQSRPAANQHAETEPSATSRPALSVQPERSPAPATNPAPRPAETGK